MNTCPHCLEEVKEQAKKCPHCCEWIRTNAQWKRSLITIIPIALIFGSYLYISNAIKEDTLSRINAHPSAESLEIISHHQMKTEDSTYIVGQIRNNGSEYYDYLKVEASLYDKNDKLVDIDSTSLSGKFKPNEVRPFKIVSGCKKHRHSKNYDHYELKLRAGL